MHGLPPEIRDLSLDMSFSPESTHQVVDADSSQMRAAAAVVKGHDIVIEGPPGTGKSQTITNLVAQALAAGKSVLFVAEKMAALDVVHRRLVGAGLGEFCLELHSSKANKRAVMKELSTALDSSLQAVAGATGAGKKLPELRKVLDGYVKEAHKPAGTLGMSPFRVTSIREPSVPDQHVRARTVRHRSPEHRGSVEVDPGGRPRTAGVVRCERSRPAQEGRPRLDLDQSH